MAVPLNNSHNDSTLIVRKKMPKLKLANMVLQLASITDFDEEDFLDAIDYEVRWFYAHYSA